MNANSRAVLMAMCSAHPSISSVAGLRVATGLSATAVRDAIQSLRWKGLIMFDALSPSPGSLAQHSNSAGRGSDRPVEAAGVPDPCSPAAPKNKTASSSPTARGVETESRSQAPAVSTPTPSRGRMARVAAPEAGSHSNVPVSGVKRPSAGRDWIDNYQPETRRTWRYDPDAVRIAMSRRGEVERKARSARAGKIENASRASSALNVEAAQQAEIARQCDPFEQAKTFLQRLGPVFPASMRDGPEGSFVISGKPGFHTREQLIALAKAKGWQA